MKWDLRIRCSALGKIMTNPRSKKSGELSKTCKTYIEELFLEQEFGIKKEFWSKYTDKGIRVEKDSIRLANRILHWHLTEEEIEQEQHYFQNQWISGHTDICDHVLADVKSSWCKTTFPFFATEIPNKDYYYQLMGYMWLTHHDKAELTYCLVDTPEDLILDDIRREHWTNNSVWQGDEDEDIVEYVRAKHDLSNLPESMRVKNFIVERDDEVIEKMKWRIAECRQYYDTLLEKNEQLLSARIN